MAEDTREHILRIAEQRILVLDGAMGTLLQRRVHDETAFRGERFRDHTRALKGNFDVLVLSQPGAVRAVHDEYLAAGADVIETNTFRATSVAQAPYGLETAAAELNYAGARLARAAADEWSERTPDKPRFVAGAIGPIVGHDGIAVALDAMVPAFEDQVRALIDGGVDVLLFETIVDLRNVEAFLAAIRAVFAEKGVTVPLMFSATVTEESRRLLSGETLRDLWTSIAAVTPLSVGVNCAFGVEKLRPAVEELALFAPALVSAHPNAGLPGANGDYDDTSGHMGALVGEWARSGLVNIVGGCCGTTPPHIRAIAEATRGVAPRRSA